MSAELVKELIDAGIHYGHRASRWNPKMGAYIFGKRDLIHVINVKETYRGLLLAKKFISQTVSQGKDICIVGTKRQARKCVQEHADDAQMHWVTDRWLGGTLTNFREIRKRVGRLDELELLEAEGNLDAYSKKEGASLRREMRKIRRNLGGIRKMLQLPGALVVIDQRREVIAIREARKLHIPVICLLDTDSDPDMVDIAIPGNDDAMRAIDVIVRELCQTAKEGVALRAKVQQDEDDAAQQRRSRRATTARADDSTAQADVVVAAATATDDAAPVQAPAAPEAPAPAEAPAAAETPAAPAAEEPAGDDVQAPQA